MEYRGPMSADAPSRALFSLHGGRRAGLVCIASASFGCASVDDLVPIVAPTRACAPTREETIACTIDGDTVDFGSCTGDAADQVRLLGIDAPETEKANTPAECFADAATEFTRLHLDGRQVRLEFDALCVDIYDRNLAWVIVEGDESDPLYDVLVDLGGLGIQEGSSDFEVLFSEVLARGGYADLYEYETDVRYYDQIELAVEAAQTEGRGMWESCGD